MELLLSYPYTTLPPYPSPYSLISADHEDPSFSPWGFLDPGHILSQFQTFSTGLTTHLLDSEFKTVWIVFAIPSGALEWMMWPVWNWLPFWTTLTHSFTYTTASDALPYHPITCHSKTGIPPRVEDKFFTPPVIWETFIINQSIFSHYVLHQIFNS